MIDISACAQFDNSYCGEAANLFSPVFSSWIAAHVQYEKYGITSYFSIRKPAFVALSTDLGPVYMRKNTSPARPGAERRGKFQPLFI